MTSIFSPVSHHAVTSQQSLSHQYSQDNGFNTERSHTIDHSPIHTSNSSSSLNSLQRTESRESGINSSSAPLASFTKGDEYEGDIEATDTSLSMNTYLDELDASMPPHTSSIAEFDHITTKINDKYALLNKPENVHSTDAYFQKIKTSIDAIPIKLAIENTRSNNNFVVINDEGVPTLSDEALKLIGSEITDIEKNIRSFVKRLDTDKTNSVWTDQRIYYDNLKDLSEIMQKELKKILEELTTSPTQLASNTQAINPTSFDSNNTNKLSVTNTYSSITSFLTNPLPFDGEKNKFHSISEKLKELDLKLSPQEADCLKEISSRIDSLVKNMTVAQLNSKRELIENPTLSLREKTSLSQAAGYLAGYQEVKKIKIDLKNLASRIEKQSTENSLSDTLRDYARLFRAQGHQYKAHMLVENLGAHAIFIEKNQFKALAKSPRQGSEINLKSGIELKGGGKLSISHTPVSFSLTAKIGGEKTVTISTSSDGKITAQQEKNISAGGEANAMLSAITATASAVTKRTASSHTFEGTSLKDVSTHLALKDNSDRMLPQTVLAHPKIQKLHQFYMSIKNAGNKAAGFEKEDPRVAIYGTIETLENASGSRSMINSMLKKLNIHFAAQQESSTSSNLFTLNEIAPLSTGSIAASQRGTTHAQKNPSEVITAEVNLTATASTSGAHSELPKSAAPFNGILPKIDLSMGAAYTYTSSLLNQTTLEPTHQLMSMAHTRSYKTSLDIAEQIRTSVWQANGKGGKALPAHLEDANNLILKITKEKNEPFTADRLEQNLTQATKALENLKERFNKFEEAIPLFMEATLDTKTLSNSINNRVRVTDMMHPHYKKNFNATLTDIVAHQLDKDKQLQLIDTKELVSTHYPRQLPHSLHSVAQDTIGRVWDTYTSALGMIELAALGRLPESYSLVEGNLQLQKKIEDFGTQYKALADKLAKPDLPLVLDKLYRYASIISPDISKKTSHTMKVEGTLSLNTPAPLRGITPNIPTDTAGEVQHKSGTAKMLEASGNVSTKETTPEKTNNPFSHNSSYTVNLSNSIGSILNGNITLPLELSAHASAADIASKCIARYGAKLEHYNAAFKAVAQAIRDDDGSPQSPSSTTIATGPFLKNAGLGEEKSRPATITINTTNGQIESIAVTLSTIKELKLATPDVGPYCAPSASAQATYSKSETATHTAINIMGPEFMYNIRQLGELKKYDLDKEQFKDIEQYLSTPTPDTAGLKKLFTPFFEAAQSDKSVCHEYFGANALGGVLDEFAATAQLTQNSPIQYQGRDLFHPTMLKQYIEHKSTEMGLAKSVLTEVPFNTAGVWLKTGASPDLMALWLKENTRDGKTISAFLENADAKDRMDFFTHSDLGIQLFAHYILILNTGKDIKSTFTKVELALSSFAIKQSAPEKTVPEHNDRRLSQPMPSFKKLAA
ncbi:MAG: hypothetical protein IT497_06685 [Ottowia sp.]|nr:hypothetical protein [Ottowia sp.]